LILAAYPVEPGLGLCVEIGGRRQEEQRYDALAHVPSRTELVETFKGSQPMWRYEANDDPAGPGRGPQRFGPFVTPGDTLMVNENIIEAVGAQPIRERISLGIVVARMTYEKNGHRPNSPSTQGAKPDCVKNATRAANRDKRVARISNWSG
jgi:hypothetical protein